MLCRFLYEACSIDFGVNLISLTTTSILPTVVNWVVICWSHDVSTLAHQMRSQKLPTRVRHCLSQVWHWLVLWSCNLATNQQITRCCCPAHSGGKLRLQYRILSRMQDLEVEQHAGEPTPMWTKCVHMLAYRKPATCCQHEQPAATYYAAVSTAARA